MKVLLIVACLAVAALCQSPPVWPVRFQQDFVESYTNSHLHTVGKIWYDTERNMQRVERNDGRLDPICGSLKNQTTPCSQLMRDGLRYIVFHLLKDCCVCCDSAHGCGVTKRDWARFSKFAGKEDLSGQTFNKFVDEEDMIEYWTTIETPNIPRKLYEDKILIKDYIMNTYSEGPINEEVFALPSFCSPTKWCPKESRCGRFQA
jgi:hypothetical protein